MEESLNNLLITLNNYSIFGYPLDTLMPYLLTLIAGLCILIDYLFDTDVPAYFGYMIFGAVGFMVCPAGFRESLLVGLLVWSLLLNMHFMFLREILERDPDEDLVDA